MALFLTGFGLGFAICASPGAVTTQTVELQAPQPDGKIYFMVWDPGQCVSLQEGAEWGLK